ncbi:NAD(P)-binding domain-containing protein [Caballeronia sp. dw_19]|uniref:NADPH-dependent F420 reductase n=1 Tax=Caballeronia sp. dw_19 TaxID=2719791 RepID=UPI001BD51676|nr:NAD(P)-binding domain-containing protein [Caballeronia sp. dw_19]
METLKISVLGTGDMGGAIATALKKRTNHTIHVRGSNDASISSKKLVGELGVTAATPQDLSTSDIVFIVVPATELIQAAATLGGYTGIVVAVSVSGTVGRDGQPSSAETLAASLPGAKVVSAFTSIWSDVIRTPGTDGQVSAFVASDHEDAKAAVSGLAKELGFRAIDGGSLANAVYAEAMGMFAVRLAIDSGYGRTISFSAFNVR